MLTNQTPESVSSQGNAILSLLHSALKGMTFVDIVLVREVEGDVLTVLPLVNDVDVSGRAIANQDVYQIPYLRLQAGNSAVKWSQGLETLVWLLSATRTPRTLGKPDQRGPHQLSAATRIPMRCT